MAWLTHDDRRHTDPQERAERHEHADLQATTNVEFLPSQMLSHLPSSG